MLRRIRRLFARQEVFDRLSGRALAIAAFVTSLLTSYVVMALALQLNPSLVAIVMLLALGALLAEMLNLYTAEAA